jgi:hypothetical protein
MEGGLFCERQLVALTHAADVLKWAVNVKRLYCVFSPRRIESNFCIPLHLIHACVIASTSVLIVGGWWQLEHGM